MGESPSDVTLSWVDPVIPAWYTATFTRAKALPTTLEMTAPAHFMEHRYLAFNAPVTITPPPRRWICRDPACIERLLSKYFFQWLSEMSSSAIPGHCGRSPTRCGSRSSSGSASTAPRPRP